MLKFYLSLFLLCPILLTAQNSNVEEIAVRFKTGLNFAQILGPSESVNGEEAEEYSFRTGFHVSGGIDYAWSEKWGARAMIGYSQKGSAFDFDGPSYLQFINPATNLPLFSVGGNRRMTLNITNSFIELPLSAYGRFGRVEVELGATIGYLITSRADGELTYSNVS
ncbi:MAG: outer membrane beta-barrel protein, partial [Bacteroidota bacterium]